ncbi:MAG: hypothetical protein R2697_04055 [Ilumatobacteraceae bacterium]
MRVGPFRKALRIGDQRPNTVTAAAMITKALATRQAMSSTGSKSVSCFQ